LSLGVSRSGWRFLERRRSGVGFEDKRGSIKEG
jgi:hypothetical protein